MGLLIWNFCDWLGLWFCLLNVNESVPEEFAMLAIYLIPKWQLINYYFFFAC